MDRKYFFSTGKFYDYLVEADSVNQATEALKNHASQFGIPEERTSGDFISSRDDVGDVGDPIMLIVAPQSEPHEVWIVKHLRDLSSGQPETDVALFSTAKGARSHVDGLISQGGWEVFDDNKWYHEGEDEYLEIEGPVSVLNQ